MKKIILAVSIATIITTNILYVNEIKKSNQCYRTLVEDDIIYTGCDKYFINDEWYKEYRKEGSENMPTLQEFKDNLLALLDIVNNK